MLTESTIIFLELDHLDHPALQSLWEGQRDYHGQLASPFAAGVGSRRFADRCAELRDKAQQLLVELAQDPVTGNYLAYSICTITAAGVGELDSLFVDAAYRGQGIGSLLMRRALAWMDTHGVCEKRICVAGGNEAVLAFYQQYGFFTRTYVMIQAPQ